MVNEMDRVDFEKEEEKLDELDITDKLRQELAPEEIKAALDRSFGKSKHFH